MNICMAGAKGKMGRRILDLAAAAEDIGIGSAFDLREFAGEDISAGAQDGDSEVVTLAPDAATAMANADVLIDFTVAKVCLDNVRAATDAGKPSVIGTTGLTDAQKDELADLAKTLPIVFAPNISVGVNLLFKLTRDAATVLGLDYNVEIIDIHHNTKVDSPSGTAERLGEIAAEALDLDFAKETVRGREGIIGKRPKREIGIHALRGGDVPGEHTVVFLGQGERIELSHRAINRDNFARGALIAAKFVAGASPGLYDMQDVLGLR